ncbi:hypothetical protein [Halobacterium sp. CBA1126]|uniref:hypothetical protein n=1 Tax=Halobacterium sp. CBA1126 TaxID=2668074 RepID=UPI0012F92F3A|nr:hypothetical protein [Halobacterium sp. CBA1126]MUV60618.1 hypothetical protein [Halobacterium sp. CBA1126]
MEINQTITLLQDGPHVSNREFDVRRNCTLANEEIREKLLALGEYPEAVGLEQKN